VASKQSADNQSNFASRIQTNSQGLCHGTKLYKDTVVFCNGQCSVDFFGQPYCSSLSNSSSSSGGVATTPAAGGECDSSEADISKCTDSSHYVTCMWHITFNSHKYYWSSAYSCTTGTVCKDGKCTASTASTTTQIQTISTDDLQKIQALLYNIQAQINSYIKQLMGK
jgi:hypothetical protein